MEVEVGIELGRDGAHGIRKVVRILGSKLTVSHPVSPSARLSHRWPSRSPSVLAQSRPFLSMALDWLEQRMLLLTPPSHLAHACPRCDRALQHPALADLMFQRGRAWGRGPSSRCACTCTLYPCRYLDGLCRLQHNGGVDYMDCLHTCRGRLALLIIVPY